MTLSWSFAIAIALSIMLATLPVMISIVQTSSVEKQRKIICSLDGLPVSRTEYYRIAMYYIRNVEPATLNSSYRTPILFFSFVVLFLSSMTFMGTLEESYFRSYSVILGAMHTISNPNEVEAYQKGTFVVGAWAFVGAYIYLLYRLISRINNNDVYPITFYYYTNRLIIACLVAGVARHAVDVVSLDSMLPTKWLTVLGFAIGWRPDLWISTIYSKLTHRFNIFHGQAEPSSDLLPVRLSLDLLQGINNDHRERLEELDIKDCHDLANQNPFIIFARTPYPLLLIVDWMAQAQLAILVGERDFAKYRTEKKIRNIFMFQRIIEDNEIKEASILLGLEEDIVLNLKWYLQTCPCVGRLRDVRGRLAEQTECHQGSWRPILVPEAEADKVPSAAATM